MNNGKSNKLVLLSSAKMAIATFSSRILGLVREQAIAAVFGASGVTDAFTIAYRIPNMLRDLFAEGSFSSAFVPIFTEVKQIDERRARSLLWSMAVTLGILTSLISILIMIFAPQLVQYFTNEIFTADKEKFEITVTLIRIMSPFLVLVSLAALFMGALNTLKIFFVPSLAPAFFNIVMIISIFTLPDLLEERGFHPVLSLGFGVIGGGLIQMLVQIPLLYKHSFGPIGPIELFTKNSRRILHRVGIGTIGIAATQINIIITTILATGTVVGAVSWLNFGFRLFQFPVGVLSVSIAGSNLVHFSDAWKRGDKAAAIELLKSSYFLSLLLIIPALSLLYALSQESVHLVFERGAFNLEDTLMTTMALRYYLLGLPFYGLYKVFAPTFFTLDKPRIPVKVSVFSIFCNVIFCSIFVPMYGFKILALGTSLSMMLNATLLAILLKRELDLGLNFFINLRVIKVLIAGGACLVATELLSVRLFIYSDQFLLKSIKFSLIGFAGVFVYALFLLILGEYKFLRKLMRR